MDKLAPLQVVALTLWGEARSLDVPGRIAVGLVIAHRATDPRRHLDYGERWTGVCLQPSQFSCWGEAGGAANYAAVQALGIQVQAGSEPKGPNAWTECLWIAEGIMEGVFVDTVSRATHYLTKTLYEQRAPGWVKGHTPVAEVSGHLFFRL